MAANHSENKNWMSIPQFGGWDQANAGPTSYSRVFSQARANRKEHKINIVKHASIGNERDFMAVANAQSRARSQGRHQQEQEDDSVMRKKILTYINCCIRP